MNSGAATPMSATAIWAIQSRSSTARLSTCKYRPLRRIGGPGPGRGGRRRRMLVLPILRRHRPRRFGSRRLPRPAHRLGKEDDVGGTEGEVVLEERLDVQGPVPHHAQHDQLVSSIPDLLGTVKVSQTALRYVGACPPSSPVLTKPPSSRGRTSREVLSRVRVTSGACRQAGR
jgi:hypothetical protein